LNNLESLLRSIGLGFGDVFLANVILCARSSGGESGGKNIDVERSMTHCCINKGHLWQLINIVRPFVIATLGGAAFTAIRRTLKTKGIDVSAHGTSDLQVQLPYRDRPVYIVPLSHPVAWPKDRTPEQQKGDYQGLRTVLDTCCLD